MSTPKAAKAATSATERALKIVENSSRIRVQDLKDNFGAKTARGFVTKYTNHVGVFLLKKYCNFMEFEKNNSELLINKTKNWKSDQLFLSTVKVWVLWIRQRSRRSAGSGATSSSRGSDSSPEWNNSTPISSNRNSRAFQKSIISKIQPFTEQTFSNDKSFEIQVLRNSLWVCVAKWFPWLWSNWPVWSISAGWTRIIASISSLCSG